MNCIIIEDEKPAARYLERQLQKLSVQPVAVLNSIRQSVEWLSTNPEPDLIFLDIQLGDGVSFEIFEKIQPKSAIIFTTAYDEYAVKAFKFNSIDYLLKPIDPEELKRAIQKFNNQKTNISWDAFKLKELLNQNFEIRYRERMLVHAGNSLKTIETDNISCFYSKDKSTYLFTENREYPVELSLNELENQLNPKEFFRINRSVIVHLKFVDKIKTHSGSRYILEVKNVSEPLIVSRERTAGFKNWLEG